MKKCQQNYSTTLKLRSSAQSHLQVILQKLCFLNLFLKSRQPMTVPVIRALIDLNSAKKIENEKTIIIVA